MSGRKGEKHPLFGTKFRWATDGTINRRLSLEDELPDQDWHWGFARRSLGKRSQ